LGSRVRGGKGLSEDSGIEFYNWQVKCINKWLAFHHPSRLQNVLGWHQGFSLSFNVVNDQCASTGLFLYSVP
jgi:hypothetical protein